MKKLVLLCMLLLLLAVGWSTRKVAAQQIPFPTQYLYNTSLYNQGGMGTENNHRVFLSTQMRKIGFKTNSRTTLVSFSSKPLTPNRVIGLGVNLINDREYTEGRTSLNGVVSYHIINNGESNDLGEERTRLSAGGSMGLVLWSSNYSDIPLFDRSDPLFLQQSTTAMDAGIGVDFLIGRPAFQIQAGFSMQQLPAAFYKSTNYTFIPNAYMMGAASGMFRLSDGVWAGPSLLFKSNLPNDEGRSFAGGYLDLNAKVAFPGKKIYAGLGYRLRTAGVNLAYGMRLVDKSASYWDLSFIAEYPLNNSRLFGPSLDLGLAFGFGGN